MVLGIGVIMTVGTKARVIVADEAGPAVGVHDELTCRAERALQ